MKKIIGIILIVMATYVPISLFANIPPFSTDKAIYYYESIPLLLNKLSKDIDLKSISNQGVMVETYSEIKNPEYYGLKLKRMSHADANLWYYPSLGIFVMLMVSGVAFIYLL